MQVKKGRESWYIIAYDVREMKRLRRVHYHLSKHAMGLQLSVYLLRANSRNLRCLCEEILKKANQTEDDIRIYPITHPNEIWTAGTQLKKLKHMHFSGKQKQEEKKGLIPWVKGLLEKNK